MLEGPSYLVSRDLPSSCEQESKWIYNTFRLIELSSNKRRLQDGEEKTLRKSSKLSDALEGEKVCRVVNDFSNVQNDQSIEQLQAGNHSDIHDVSDTQIDQSNDHNQSGDCSDIYDFSHEKNEQSNGELRAGNLSDIHDFSDAQTDESNDQHEGGVHSDILEFSHAQTDQSNDQHPAGEHSDLSSLVHQLGRDISINCLLRCPRSEYGSVASLNRSFRSLIQGGELYRLRRQMGIVEHWVYFSCTLLEWEAYDPNHNRWMHLPRMTSNECFMCSDKESLAVGTELLVFGKEITSHVIYRYSILTNTWSSGMKMNTPRCLFGSASFGEIAILAGGCDPCGNILSSAELYNSETGTWRTLRSMNKPRKMCSGMFMDGKFYVIGGIGTGNPKSLTCGEVYDLETETWTEIPNMFPARNGGVGLIEAPAAAEAPPLVAVVNNTLYAADYAEKEVRRYDKERNEWVTIGGLPERAVSMNGWGLAFRACGDRLIVIGGPRVLGGGIIELNSWIPNEEAPQWDLLASKQSGSFVYNCTVMGC
ncbi:Kelch repeat type [Parasponia andersonii]|uniref:Kelch repeat type n=1 Tax=Parasponia andersonii TaxID=3476 RepID=A0A2P5C8C7_PARAD|nr:Kelch repeat type [Parasponia andersonii]